MVNALRKAVCLLWVCFLSVALAKKGRRKKADTFMSGVVSSRLKWRQDDNNLISTTVDLSKHSLSMPPVVFTSLTSRRASFSSGYDIDLGVLDTYTLANVTGKTFPDPKLSTKSSFALQLRKEEGNMTAASANSANYKVRYVLWTREHPSEEVLHEKYEDVLDSRDLHFLGKLSYLDFLQQVLKEESESMKGLLGKSYVKTTHA